MKSILKIVAAAVLIFSIASCRQAKKSGAQAGEPEPEAVEAQAPNPEQAAMEAQSSEPAAGANPEQAAPDAQNAAQEEDLDAEYGKNLLKAGTKAPEIAMKDMDGKDFSLSAMKGKYVVIDFWASWCPDCTKEIPDLVNLYKEYSPKGVAFVGVSFDDDEAKWKEAVKKYGLTYTHVSELCRMKDSSIAKEYGIKWIPTTYLIGPDGNVKVATVVFGKVESALKEAFPGK
jgi:peroxiredoxin